MRQVLNFSFWDRHPLKIATQLIGCELVMEDAQGRVSAGYIVETEAYSADEEACHAYSRERVKHSSRVAQFFGDPGRSYIYLNYGIHKLLNIISGPKDAGGSVLIRAVEPSQGVEFMKERRGFRKNTELTNGPGKLTEALGIDLRYNDIDICNDKSPLKIFANSSHKKHSLLAGPRVGISKAQDLPWRFAQKDSAYISRAKENRDLKLMTVKD